MSEKETLQQLCDLHSDLHSELERRTGIHTFYADKISAMASLVLDAATIVDKYARLRTELQEARDKPAGAKYSRGDRVRKIKGSSWQGHVVGFYSTDLTQIGYCVESEREHGSVQLYPEAALEPVDPAAIPQLKGSR